MSSTATTEIYKEAMQVKSQLSKSVDNLEKESLVGLIKISD